MFIQVWSEVMKKPFFTFSFIFVLSILVVKSWVVIERPLIALIMVGVLPGTDIELSFESTSLISIGLLVLSFWQIRHLYKQRIRSNINDFDLLAI